MSYEFGETEEEHIRPPDKIVRERLIGSRHRQYIDREEDNIESQLNTDLQDVLEQSMLEYALAEIEKQEKVELENITRKQQENRKKSIESFIKKINHLSTFDTKINEIKQVIEPTLHKYIEHNIIDKIEDEKIYKNVNEFIKTIRIQQCEKDILQNLFKLKL